MCVTFPDHHELLIDETKTTSGMSCHTQITLSLVLEFHIHAPLQFTRVIYVLVFYSPRLKVSSKFGTLCASVTFPEHVSSYFSIVLGIESIFRVSKFTNTLLQCPSLNFMNSA